MGLSCGNPVAVAAIKEVGDELLLLVVQNRMNVVTERLHMDRERRCLISAPVGG